MNMIRVSFFTVLGLLLKLKLCFSVNPHIIFILADDLGWNDVGFHGSNQIPTPNIDALAYTGIILNNYYVSPVCTPSRSALMTAKYPIHTGTQHGVIHGSTPFGLPLSETIFPKYLKSASYVTRIVGKWHLGSFRKEYTPEYRGFDSHYGYWTGHQDYYDHTAIEKYGYWGYDMRRGMNITWEDYNNYTTDLLTDEAIKVEIKSKRIKIIKRHDKKKPLFLYLAHLAVHSANPYSPLQAPRETVSKFWYIKNKNRRLFAGMLSKLDESIGLIMTALAEANMLNDSIIIFSTDNGGPAAGFNLNAASNWPLRGVKDTLWEGGVRGAAFIWSFLLPSFKVSNSLMHITDWLPTLLSLTNVSNIPKNIDGVNVWKCLTEDAPSPREEILLNIDLERNVSALKYKNWKYKKGNGGSWNDWYGPSGRNMSYNYKELYNSLTAKAIKEIKPLPNERSIDKIRKAAQVKCDKHIEFQKSKTVLSETYLFDLDVDPCEKVNLASKRPDIVKEMEKKMRRYEKTIVLPRNKPTDPRSNPIYWDNAWINWMDYI